MDIHEEKLGDVAVVGLKGRLDAASVAATEKHLVGLATSGIKGLVLDLAGLEYISSAGLRVLLVTAKTTKAKGGKMVVCAVQRYVKEVFDISGFSSVFPLVGTRDEAVAAVSQ